MADTERERVKILVVDSGGFINNAPVSEIGENVYTIREVVNEIRDKPTRQRLQVLSYELQFLEPSPEALKTVTDFAKKTGDYRSLSAVDIKLMALVYHMEKQTCGTEHIKVQPNSEATWSTTRHLLQKPSEIAGFYLGKKGKGDSQSEMISHAMSPTDASTDEPPHANMADTSTDQIVPSEDAQRSQASDEMQTNVSEETTDMSVDVTSSDVPGSLSACERSSLEGYAGLCTEGDTLDGDCLGEESESEDEEDEGDDEDGWITPKNIASVRKAMGSEDHESKPVSVGCLTMDFSMQNVLIQMGLNVVSVDGMLIKKAKSYVQRCSACQKITTAMDKEFCPVCGNHTLQRLAMTVDHEGCVHYCFSRRRPANVRGLKYSLPAPRGGKYAVNPVLCADQLLPQQRMSRKSKVKYDVFEAGYEAYSSPFAPKDTMSRSVQLGFHSRQKKRNPNENKNVYGRRK